MSQRPVAADWPLVGREAQAAAARDGALVDWVQATSSAATVPLGAFAGLIPGDARSDNPLELML